MLVLLALQKRILYVVKVTSENMESYFSARSLTLEVGRSLVTVEVLSPPLTSSNGPLPYHLNHFPCLGKITLQIVYVPPPLGQRTLWLVDLLPSIDYSRMPGIDKAGESKLLDRGWTTVDVHER